MLAAESRFDQLQRLTDAFIYLCSGAVSGSIPKFVKALAMVVVGSELAMENVGLDRGCRERPMKINDGLVDRDI